MILLFSKLKETFKANLARVQHLFIFLSTNVSIIIHSNYTYLHIHPSIHLTLPIFLLPSLVHPSIHSSIYPSIHTSTTVTIIQRNVLEVSCDSQAVFCHPKHSHRYCGIFAITLYMKMRQDRIMEQYIQYAFLTVFIAKEV